MLKEYFSIAEILELKLEWYTNDGRLFKKTTEENWLFRTCKTTKKDGKEYHISNFPAVVREKIVVKLLEKAKGEAKLSGKNTQFVIESHNIAYSRLEIVLFLRATNMRVYEFCKTYNNREFMNNEISENAYFYVPNTSKSRVYKWIKQYDLKGIDGLKWRVDERKLGKAVYVDAVDMGIKDLIF